MSIVSFPENNNAWRTFKINADFFASPLRKRKAIELTKQNFNNEVDQSAFYLIVAKYYQWFHFPLWTILFAEKEHPQEANADPDFSLVPDQRRIRIVSQTPGNTIPTEDGILLDSSPEAPEASNQSEQSYYLY